MVEFPKSSDHAMANFGRFNTARDKENQRRDIKLLELLWGDFRKRRIIHAFRRCLTPKGFEEYASKYFARVEGYPTEVIGGLDDHWVDVQGVKIDEKGIECHVFIQCKRWSAIRENKEKDWIINRKEVTSFMGEVSGRRAELWDRARFVYLTTSYFTRPAEAFCQEEGIETIDCLKLAKMDASYGIREFIRDILENEPERQCDILVNEEIKEYFSIFQSVEDESDEITDHARSSHRTLRVELRQFDKENSAFDRSWRLRARNPNNAQEDDGITVKEIVLAAIFVAICFGVISSFTSDSDENQVVVPVKPQISRTEIRGTVVAPWVRKKNLPQKKNP